ncbi:hypothetical protein FB446DRAFT_373795 [Lentinula raphanica]|nr:hypothetical protein FB446DRAFT_373795 [Lentinula raphanica]
MRGLLSLPNELLHFIIEYIIFTPRVPDTHAHWLKSPLPDLLSLSLACWQLRRVCRPFLFAKITLNHAEDAVKHMTVFSTFIKTLIIGRFDFQQGTEDRFITEILAQLNRSIDIVLRSCRTRTVLLKALLARPSVTSVFVHETPDESMRSYDLSKVILTYCSDSPLPLNLDIHLNQGMRVTCLEISKPSSLPQYENKIFSGLKEIQFHMGVMSASSFSWPPALLANHTTLDEVWLYGVREHHSAHDVPPFLSSMIEKFKQSGVYDSFDYIKFRFQRAIGQTSQEWHVTELTLLATTTSTFLNEALMLVASLVPKLEVLTLDLLCHRPEYHIV